LVSVWHHDAATVLPDGRRLDHCQRFPGGVNPADATVTVLNVGSEGIAATYTIAVVDQAHNPSPLPSWLSLDKALAPAAHGPIVGGGTDIVTLSFNTAGLPSGPQVAVLEFTDGCDPANKSYHTVTLGVNCPLSFAPAASAATGFLGVADPDPAFLTVQNVGDVPGSYTIEELDNTQTPADVPWLSVDKPSGGPMPAGTIDTVTLSFDITKGPNGEPLRSASTRRTCGSAICVLPPSRRCTR